MPIHLTKNYINALQNPMLTNLVEKKSPPLIGVNSSGPIRSDSNEENQDEPSSKKSRTDVRFYLVLFFYLRIV